MGRGQRREPVFGMACKLPAVSPRPPLVPCSRPERAKHGSPGERPDDTIFPPRDELLEQAAEDQRAVAEVVAEGVKGVDRLLQGLSPNQGHGLEGSVVALAQAVDGDDARVLELRR